MKDSPICYSVGALMYTPANNPKIADDIASGRFGNKYSVALCLEDTIRDNCVTQAENILVDSMKKLYSLSREKQFYMPKIFVRVRYSKQMQLIYRELGAAAALLKGFIIPKLSLLNIDAYINAFLSVKRQTDNELYLMPILECEDIIDPICRIRVLSGIRDKLIAAQKDILNIRVGGNDLCNSFGLRRHQDETIYDIRPIADILTDIIAIFGREYVISGPVWEYYSGEGWDTGMKKEIAMDIRAGFIGKTVIHPNQIRIVNEALMIPESDYNDAKAILGWDSENLVASSADSSRMNEYKTHYRWARKIMYLADYYGIRKN